MSSIVRRPLAARAPASSPPDANEGPRLVRLDADTAVMLAIDATRGMLDVCLRAPEPPREPPIRVQPRPAREPAIRVEARPAREPVATAEPAPRPASEPPCQPWRALEVKRAYLSTLPPPPEQEARPSRKRWA